MPKNQGWFAHEIVKNSFWKNFHILFVGDGPDAPELRNILEGFVPRKQVTTMGWTENVSSIYPALDLLIVPSLTEGVPLVMLEALAHGIPVVGTNRGGMKQWLPNAWRFEINDGGGMRRAVTNALSGIDENFWRDTNLHLDRIQDRNRFAEEFHSAIQSFV
jgi:glycosyltransferase involved in cell wall biosynthesis